jgi:hypothetical protein
MTSSLLVAAPLMIAAIVMAFRFVGCGIDASQLPSDGDGDGDGNGDGNGNGTKPLTVRANLTGTGTLTGTASFPSHDPATQRYDGADTYSFAIPFWCTRIDLVLLGAGGGGSYSDFGNGVVGGAGGWQTVTLARGTGIAWATTTIDVTVGQGGSGGAPNVAATPGGDTTASWDTTTQTATGGGGGATTGAQSGNGPSPTSDSVGDATLAAGAAQLNAAAAGNAPGGGGSGGDVFGQGGAGADGAAIIVVSNG